MTCVPVSFFSSYTVLNGIPQTASIRADDHSTIGGILFAVITPALFWKRANSINRE